MDYKKELQDLIKTLKRLTNKTQEEISVGAGYKKKSLTQILSSGEGAEAAIKRLRIAYKNELSYSTSSTFEETLVSEPQQTYLHKRRNLKAAHIIATAPLIPAKAQAGYVRAVDQEKYMHTLEQYALPPGVDPRGAHWAYWEVQGDSMEPAFRNGDLILTSQVHPMDWENIRNFYVYVIVTDERVLIKRVAAKNDFEWALISENEDHYPQQLLSVQDVKQLWVFRRRIEASAPPTKTFEIKV